MGCGDTLHLNDEGVVKCAADGCTAPAAVSEIIADGETEHVVALHATTFAIKHPLRERLDDALLDCPLHEDLEELDGPPHPVGTYRVTAIGGWPHSRSGWAWTAL